MTAAQRAKYRKQLLALQKALIAQGTQKFDPNRTSEEEIGQDEDEQPLNEMLQAIASNRNRNADTILQKVAQALRKLSEAPDSFGECEDCDEPIIEGRLKAMPYAQFCVACQAKHDPRRNTPRKNLTDYV